MAVFASNNVLPVPELYNSDISLAIDLDWEKNYVNRSDHPKSEAENVLLDSNNNILQIKKNIQKHILKNIQMFGIMEIIVKKQKIMGTLYMVDQIQHLIQVVEHILQHNPKYCTL